MKRRVKGSSILEILIALVLLSVCATVVSLIHIKLQGNNKPVYRINALQVAESTLLQYSKVTATIHETLVIRGYTLKVTKVPDFNYPDCHQVRVVVFDSFKNKIIRLEKTVHN